MLFVILGILATIALFVALGLTVEKVENSYGYEKEQLKFKLQKKQVLCLAGLLIILLGCFTTIPSNHVGIVYSPFGGTKQETLGEGFAAKSPFDKVYKISTETQTKKIKELTTQTKDAQYLTTKMEVKYKVNNANAFLVFKQYKTLDNMSSSLIRPTTQRVLEHITTKYNIIDILGEKRNDVYAELENELTKEFAKYGVEFDSVSITDMDAGAALEKAISEEAVAKKAAETAEQDLLRVETEAKQKSVQAKADQEAAKIKAETKIINAKATKEANELLSKSLSDKLIQQMWIEQWNGKLPTYYGGDANLMIGVGESK